MSNLENHPAVQFGRWLKAQRQSHHVVKRVFANQIGLTPAQYSEVEAGVLRWIKGAQEAAIAQCLDLAGDKVKDFKARLKEARLKGELVFSNVFSRDDLEPIRCRHSDDSTVEPDEFCKEVILNAVFAELA